MYETLQRTELEAWTACAEAAAWAGRTPCHQASQMSFQSLTVTLAVLLVLVGGIVCSGTRNKLVAQLGLVLVLGVVELLHGLRLIGV